MKNKRNSNIEMLRIICMICIIIHHSFVHSGITVYYDNILIEIIKMLGPISNNIFILITGYYMVNYKTKKLNIIKLIFETIFYSYSILIINVLILKKVNSYMIIKSIFPILTNSEWFITGYLLLYLSITIINRLLENISEKEHKKMIIFGIIVFSILPTIELLNSYFSIYIWLIFLYIVGAFIGKYKEKYNELIKKGWIVFLLSIVNLVFIINQNKEELSILTEYLPKQLSAEEVEEIVKGIVAETGATSIKEMGMVMKSAKEKIGASADGKMISEAVKKILA